MLFKDLIGAYQSVCRPCRGPAYLSKGARGENRAQTTQKILLPHSKTPKHYKTLAPNTGLNTSRQTAADKSLGWRIVGSRKIFASFGRQGRCTLLGQARWLGCRPPRACLSRSHRAGSPSPTRAHWTKKRKAIGRWAGLCYSRPFWLEEHACDWLDVEMVQGPCWKKLAIARKEKKGWKRPRRPKLCLYCANILFFPRNEVWSIFGVLKINILLFGLCAVEILR